MKKTVLIALASLVVLLVGGGIAGQAWLKGRFTKESIVAQMEAAWNCRAFLESTTVSLGSSPAMVELHGLKLAPRDEEAGKPLSQRSSFPDQAALLSADKVSLAITLGDLIVGKANVKRLHISSLNLRSEVDEEGDSNLDLMFESPEDAAEAEAETRADAQAVAVPPAGIAPVDGTTAPAPTDIVVRESGLQQAIGQGLPFTTTEPSVSGKGGNQVKKKKKRKKPKTPLIAKDLYVALQVEEASVDNARIEVVDLGSHGRTTLEKVSFALKGIDVNPSDLASHNHCGFEFSGAIRVDNAQDQSQAASFEVLGNGTLQPFDVQTGIWNPDLDLAVTVKKGGLLGGAPVSSQMKPKDLAKLKDFGLDLSNLAIGGVLQEDASTEIHAVRSKLIVKKDTRLVFPQYEISLLDTSWFNAPEDQHIIRGRLIASSELTANILQQAQQTLTDRLGESLAAIATATVTATLLDEQKRLVIPFKSKGSLSKPEVNLDTALSGATDGLKDAGRSLLEGLLGK